MAGGLAEDVFLLCWDDERGVPHRQCWKTVDVGVAGGLVADGLMAGALSIDGGQLRSHGPAGDDPLLAEVVAWTTRRFRPPRVRALLDHLARPRTRAKVRDRLVATGVLAPRRHRVLGLVPLRRFPVADAHAAAAVRRRVTCLATGECDPAQAGVRQRLLVGLAGSVGGLDLLLDESQRPAAHQRALAMTVHRELVDAVDAAADEAQALMVAGGG